MAASGSPSGIPQAERSRGSAAPDTIDSATQRAFNSTSLYLQSELETSVSDLQLLEKLNDASIAKYEGISRQAQDMLVHAYKIKQTYNEMEAQISEIDALVESIKNLEQVADELDRYSLQIEANWIKSNEAAREQRRAEYDRAYEEIAKACAELKSEMSQIYEKVAELSAKAKEQPDDDASDREHESEMHTEAEQANERIKRMVEKLQELMRRFDLLIPGLSVAMSSDIVLTVPQESATQP
ncbi:RalA-binding protein 1, partial [Coemansia sp. RSA 2599]